MNVDDVTSHFNRVIENSRRRRRQAAFVKRKPDIVSDLSLAAAFVEPLGAYMNPSVVVEGGNLALVAVVEK